MRKRQHIKARKPRRVILVICEGETEAAYVELLRRHYRIPITIKSRIVGNKVNSRLVSQILKEEGLEEDDDSYVVYMYDSDVKPIVEKLRGLKGEMILSDPCIELWFHLHHKNHTKPVSAKEMVEIVKTSLPLWMDYAKGRLTNRQKEFLLAHHDLASERARLLKPETNPSTNMYQFIDMLESVKKA